MKEMTGLSGTRRVAVVTAICAAVAVSAAAAGATLLESVRGSGGVRLQLPAGWEKVAAVREAASADPQTLLVIGTDGVRATESDCQVSSYRVPAHGAVIVVIGWRDSVGTSGFLPLSGLRLRRGTFECFEGRGAVAQVTRRGRDFQINVMVGDRASAATIDDALDAARSFALPPPKGS